MSQESDNTVGQVVSSNPGTGEADEVSVASSSALVMDCFDGREDKLAAHNALCSEAERLSEIVYWTRKRERATPLLDPVEDSLYLLILAAALGYLLIALL